MGWQGVQSFDLFSNYRHDRFRKGGLLRELFKVAAPHCMNEGLVCTQPRRPRGCRDTQVCLQQQHSAASAATSRKG
jgi:hypothetical protein